MAIGDLLFSMMGQPDPRQQLAQSLGQFPGQAGSRSGPVPGSGAGGAAPGLAQQGGAEGVPGQPPQGQPSAPPQPQAYTSPPDLAQTYLKLMQRQQANEGINTGLGLLAGAFSHNQADRSEMINAMSGLNQQQAASGIGGGGGGLGGIAELIKTQREMAMQQYMLNHVTEGAKSLGITPDQYLTGYMTGKLGDIESSIITQQMLQKSPKYQADVAESQARTGAIPVHSALETAQAQAIPANIAKTQAETAAVPVHSALETAQAKAIPSTIAKTEAEAAAVPAHVALETAQAGAVPADVALKQAQAQKALAESTAPTEALRNYKFAVAQIPPGQKVPSFDEWQANQRGAAEAATQSNLLQTQQKMSAIQELPKATQKVRSYQALADEIETQLNQMGGIGLTGAAGGNVGKWLAERGGPGAALQAKIDQLSGASGVSAVDELKGGIGRILGTEFTESESAQSRLKDQNMPLKDYIEAIHDFRNKLSMSLATVTKQSGAPIPVDLMDWLPDEKGEIPGLKKKAAPPSIDELLKKYGGKQ